MSDELSARLKTFHDEGPIVELTSAVALESNVPLGIEAQGFRAL